MRKETFSISAVLLLVLGGNNFWLLSPRNPNFLCQFGDGLFPVSLGKWGNVNFLGLPVTQFMIGKERNAEIHFQGNEEPGQRVTFPSSVCR